MQSTLSEIEKKIVTAVLSQHLKNVTRIDTALDDLMVASRDVTGAGTYIQFEPNQIQLFSPDQSPQLSFDGEILIPYGSSEILLGCVLDIDAGQLNYLELFTYGDEAWDGSLLKGRVVLPNSSDL